MQAYAAFAWAAVSSTSSSAAPHGLHPPHGLHAPHGLQGLAAAHGLHGLHGLQAAAHGLHAPHGLQGLHAPQGLAAAHGLHGLQAAGSARHHAVCSRTARPRRARIAGIAGATRPACRGTRVAWIAGAAGIRRSARITGIAGAARIARRQNDRSHISAARNRRWIFALERTRRGLNTAPQGDTHADDDGNECTGK